MNIDRKVNQNGTGSDRLKFVLDEIEKLKDPAYTFFGKTWGDRLTYEEIIGALVAAEQDLLEYEEEEKRMEALG